MHVCVCVYAPEAKTCGVILTLNKWLNNCGSFGFRVLAINVINRRGPSNEMCCQLQLKKTKVRLY